MKNIVIHRPAVRHVPVDLGVSRYRQEDDSATTFAPKNAQQLREGHSVQGVGSGLEEVCRS